MTIQATPPADFLSEMKAFVAAKKENEPEAAPKLSMKQRRLAAAAARKARIEAGGPAELATDRQVAYLESLRNGDYGTATTFGYGDTDFAALSKAEASKAISLMKSA